eukprot:1952225-Rhodomonas_salina.1
MSAPAQLRAGEEDEREDRNKRGGGEDGGEEQEIAEREARRTGARSKSKRHNPGTKGMRNGW